MTEKTPEIKPEKLPEPWLRGTLTNIQPVARGVVHALQLADEDVQKWCRPLSDDELNAKPYGLPSVAFHLRHIARSLHRLLIYAEGEQLSEAQLAALRSESEEGATHKDVFAEWSASLEATARRVRILAKQDPALVRTVGRKALPTTIGGLLVHLADHTQRHVGQAITTAKLLLAMRAQ
jgi:uncharacterized damage-inducible protein DinB